MELDFYVDCHEFGIRPKKTDLIDIIEKSYCNLDKRKYFAGDNLDIIMCKKENLNEAIRLNKKLSNISFMNYCTGNHEGSVFFSSPIKISQLWEGNYQIDNMEKFIYMKNTWLAHGDYFAWGKIKSINFRQLPHGRNFIYRAVAHITELFKFRRLSIECKERIYDFLECNNSSSIILGHFHPKKIKIIVYRGKKIVLLPKGKSTIKFKKIK